MGRAAEVVNGLGRHLVRGEEDDQLLCVRGEFERLADQPELAFGGVVEPRVPALRTCWSRRRVRSGRPRSASRVLSRLARMKSPRGVPVARA